MRRFLIAACALIAVPFAATAQDEDSAFQTSASHALIMDHESGEILYSKNGDEPMPPSSMSKLMTALMAFEAIEAGSLSLDDELPVSEHAWRTGGAGSDGSTMFLELNSRARVEDLLRGVIVQSGNDACIVLAEAISGSEEAFADAMTERAHVLGLMSANFKNSTGLTAEGHVISPADLARLARIIIEDHPDFYDLYSEREFTYNGIRQYNRNPLLGVFDGADGLKTGYTSEAGYGLTASAERNGERRITVFNGTASMRDRANEAERLMRAAFVDFLMVDLAEAGEQVGEAELYLGEARTVPLRAAGGVRVGMHRRDEDGMRAEIVYQGPVAAPVAEGEEIATLVVTLPGGRAEEFPLEAAQSVGRQGLMGQAMTALVRLIRS